MKSTTMDGRVISTPSFKHDCTTCQFLGQTIGGGKLVDLYAHRSLYPGDISRDATIIARYGDDGPEYWSTIAKEAHPEGHAELFAGAKLWEELNRHRN